MDNKQSVKAPSEMEDLYFDLLADMDFTKHLGGQHVTDELIARCRVDASKYVLDVGCGVGITPVHLAKKHGCRVVGVDIREKMIARANQRAARQGLSGQAQFETADAQRLPFEDNTFDVVICESVVAFVPDKHKAIREFLRVVKPGGYIGISEAVWIKDPTPELRAAATRPFGDNLEILSPEGWLQLFKEAGLQNINADIRPLSLHNETISRIKRIGCLNLLGMWGKALKMLFARPDHRKFLKEALSEPKELLWYWGCGIWVGRKGA